MSATPNVLAFPDSAEAVEAHHLAVVKKLNAAGYQWRGASKNDGPMIETFVRTHGQPPTDWTFDPRQSAVIAQDQTGTPVCVVVLAGMSFSGHNCVLIQHVVIHPQHTNLGIETASLNLVHQVLPPAMKPVVCSAGTCAPHEAPIYAASGYTVLQPHQPFTFPGAKAPIITPSTGHPCWAYKMGA